MANLNIAIKIAAQDQASGPIGTIVKAFGGLKDAAATGWDVVAKAAVIGVGAAAVAVGGFVAASVNEFAQFQGQMNEVFTLLPGISEEAMGAMTDDVKAFSREFGTLPEEVVPALYQAISAGVPQDNVFTFLEVAQKAAIGGVTDLETAVDGISSVVNAYGADVLDAAQASDLMFTAVRLGKTDFSQLSASLFQVIPTASALGVNFGDVTAALAAMTAQGVPTSVATTQLRQLFVELSKDGGKAANTFQDMAGVTFKEFIAQGGNTADALDLMLGAADDLGIGVNDLFGSIEAGNAALSLAGSETFVNNIDAMGESAGATNAAYETMNGGIERTVERMKAFGATAMLDVGAALSPLITQVLGFAEGALPSLQNALTTQIVPALMQFGQWLSVNLPVAIQLVSDFWVNTLQPALVQVWGWMTGTLFPALSELWTWLSANIPPALQTLSDFWTGTLQPALTQVWTWMTGTLFPALSDLWDWLQPKLGAALTALSDFWTGTLQPAITNVWSWMTGTLFPALSDLWDWLEPKLGSALQALSDYWTGTLQPALETVWGFVQDSLIPLLTDLWTLIDTTLGLALTTFAGIWQNILQPAVENFWNLIKDTVKPGLDLLESFWTNTLKPAFENVTFIETLSTAFDGLKTAITFVRDIIQGVINKLIELGDNLPDWATPGSPMPLETAFWGLGDALEDVARKKLPQLNAEVALMPRQMPALAAGGAGTQTVYNYNFTASYARSQNERTLRNDVRLVQMLTSRA